MFCQYCGSKLPENAAACPQCKRPVPSNDGTSSRISDEGRQGGAAQRDDGARVPVEPISVSCCYKAPGFLLADRIPGDLVLTGDELIFKQWKIRMLSTVMTLGLMSYSTGKGLQSRLSDIQEASLAKGWRNATLTILWKNGQKTDFEIGKSDKFDEFYGALLSRMEKSRNG